MTMGTNAPDTLTPPSSSAVLTLAIENANPGSFAGVGPLGPASVAIGWIDQGVATLLHAESIGPSTRTEDDLISAIARCCDHAGVSRRQIQCVGVDIGPGGYTALRMAVAAAKMIAMVNGASCVGVPSAEVCVEALRDVSAATGIASGEASSPSRPTIVVLATKGDSAFITRCAAGELVGAGQVMTWAELRAAGDFSVSILLMDEHAPAAWHDEAMAMGVEVRSPRFEAVALLRCVALQIADAGARAGVNEDVTNSVAALAPLYAREPEAVTIWRQRKEAQKR